jgi:kynurenine formamidase
MSSHELDFRYDGTGRDSPQWWPSRHGAEDERGAANELTEEVVLGALQTPKRGRVVDLSQVLDRRSPYGTPPRGFNMIVLAHGSLEGGELAQGENSLTYFEEHAEHGYHVGTHLDGLGHVGIGGRFYNGHRFDSIYTPGGLTKLGAEMIPPIVTRGLLLDVAGLVGVEMLPDRFQITAEHLEDAARRQGVEPRPGDAILLHTGWASLWNDDPARYEGSEPGIVVDAARWLVEQRPSLVGADNWALEVVPAAEASRPFVAHQHLITENGIFILENIVTAELRGEGVSEFMLVTSPLAVRGATGSMVRPAAVI